MVRSPCTNVCKIGQDQLCVGCRRSIEEIAAWGLLTDQQRLDVIAHLPSRGKGAEPAD